jgi:hypothetical protein
MHNTHNGELPGHRRLGEDPKISGVHNSEILGSPYEKELKASKYPQDKAKDAAKEVKEAVSAEKKEAAPAEEKPAAKEEKKEEAKEEAAPAKEAAKEEKKEAAPAAEKKEESKEAAAPAKEEAKPAKAEGLQLNSFIRYDAVPTMVGQAAEVQNAVSEAMLQPVSEASLHAMGALVQKFEPVEVENDENVAIKEDNMIQTGQQLKLSAYIEQIQGPEDL